LRRTVAEQEAKLEIKVCAHDDFMLTTARSLVNAAVEGHTRLHNTDRQAAQSWIREAAGWHAAIGRRQNDSHRK
jgi:hypothetical protein